MKYIRHKEARNFSIENEPQEISCPVKGKRKSLDYRIEHEGDSRSVIVHDDGTIEKF